MQGLQATGIMKKDRMMKCPLIDMEQMKRKETVRWNDSSVVTLGSNAYSVEPVAAIKRCVKGLGKSNKNQPAITAAFNQGMGGLDLLNRALSGLTPLIRAKNWYWPLVIHALNIAFVYSLRFF